MKRLLVLPVLAMLALGAFAADLRHDWSQKYNSIAQLFNDRNVQGISQLLAERFVMVDVNGKRHSRADAIKNEYEPLGLANYVHFDVSVPSVRKHGGDVEVSYDAKYYVVYDDPKNGHFKIHGREQGVDVWRKFGNSWLIVETHVRHANEQKVPAK